MSGSIASIWAISRLLDSGNQWWWLVVGLFAGLAMASKYTATLLWVGVALWLLVAPSARGWLLLSARVFAGGARSS